MSWCSLAEKKAGRAVDREHWDEGFFTADECFRVREDLLLVFAEGEDLCWVKCFARSSYHQP